MMRPPESVILGRYRLESRLGQGGSGVVWRARDETLGRTVAVKQVIAALAVSEGDETAARRRVLREGRAAARLNHPSVTQVYDVGSEDGVLFLVMEFVDAPSLRDLVRDRGPIPPLEAAALGLYLLDALQAAHRAGIVHRDVKPANVLVPADGPPKLTDFGIASLAGDTTVTATGLILGSPSYMAPEQATGATAGPAADLWALGATLWYAVEGAAPFDRAQPVATLAAVVHAPTPVPARAGPLAPALEAALRKDPAARADAGELAALLAAAADAHATAAAHAPPPARPVPADLDDGSAASAADGSAASPADGIAQPAWPATGPAPPAAPRATAGRRARGWLAAAVVVAVVGGAALAAVALFPPPDEAEVAAPTAPPAAEPSPEGTPEPSPERTPEPTPEHAIERVEIGPTGATVGVPEGWGPQQRSATITDYVDPEGGAFLRLDWTDEPRADPVAAWEELSASLAANRAGYEEVRIEATEVEGLPAALWEYRLQADGQARRAYNLGIAGSDFGWALNLQVAAEDWDEAQELWPEIVASFDPPDGSP